MVFKSLLRAGIAKRNGFNMDYLLNPRFTAKVNPQNVAGQLTSAAMFLTMTITNHEKGDDIRDLFGDLSSLVRAVSFRNPASELSCVTGIGSSAWDIIFKGTKVGRPKELHPFKELKGAQYAPSTPGDLFFHIRGPQMDMCFELGSQIVKRLEGIAHVEDEVHGFKYFDMRDLLGFVDGTENPTGPAMYDATLITEQDPAFAGGSYVITQKYLHRKKEWDSLPVERQEHIIGRQKLSDIELDDDEKESYSHNVLTNIEDEDGNQLQILRDNMPFGSLGKEEYGTFFIGYSCSPTRTEIMLENMFIGKPEGNYDRILDYSVAKTGNLFFIPSADFLEGAADL